MKKIKKCISLISIILIISLMCNISKVQAASSSFSASSSEVTVGTTVNLTATVTAGAWNVKISGNGVSQALVGQTDVASNKTASTTASFTPQSPGTYTFTLSGDITDFDTEENVNVSKSVTIKVNAKAESGGGNSSNSGGTSSSNGSQSSSGSNMEGKIPSESTPGTTKTKTETTTKSSNNYLSGITLGVGNLSPEFYRETYEYSVEFDDTVDLYSLTEIEVSATAEDERASIEGTGTIQLNEGENTISINVKAENGSVRTYTVKLTKPAKVEQSSLRLKTLVLNGINNNGEYQTINFELDPETFEYNLIVPNEINAISVMPTTENEDIIIETNGGESLNEGNNKIVIILTSPSDETIKTTYTINVERQVALTENTGLSQKQIGMIIIGSIIGVIILILIIVAIVKHRKKKKGFAYNDEDDYEDYDVDNENNINYMENEDDKNIKDEEIEDPYPKGIEVKENVEEAKIDKEETEDSKKEEKTSKSKLDDFCEGYEENEKESPKESRKGKNGKRFL